MFHLRVNQIISGGQTGVDRGALDACLALHFPCGGWCPKNRRAEDGRIPDQYPLLETESLSYAERTFKNIDLSDATLLITAGEIISKGTKLTADYTLKVNHPLFLYTPPALFIDEQFRQLISFLKKNSIIRLNVAGPRQSQWEQAYDQSNRLITRLITFMQESG